MRFRSYVQQCAVMIRRDAKPPAPIVLVDRGTNELLGVQLRGYVLLPHEVFSRYVKVLRASAARLPRDEVNRDLVGAIESIVELCDLKKLPDVGTAGVPYTGPGSDSGLVAG